MDKDKILFLEMKEDWQKEHVLRSLGQAHEVVFHPGTAADLPKSTEEASILSPFINSRITREDLTRFPGLRFIATRSTGYDHVDIEAAGSRGIPVANVPVYGENTVAEHTFALILSLSRNLRRAYFKTQQGDFSIDGLLGFDLKGKKLGVVGTGHIGLHVIHMARGFGLHVLAHDVRQDHFLAEVLGFQYVGFDELLAESDIVSLHVPYMKATHHLLNRDNISKIKRGAILINTSRGGLVETSALVSALDQGILSGVGLDVLEGEEFILDEKRLLESAESRDSWDKVQISLRNHILLGRANVIFTPHIAFYSKEAVTRILDTTVANIRGFLAGKPVNVVNGRG
ncbi:MAG: NAD(P)-dependent oxidoreductase [Candidatus Omnitrophota bacterium]|jgi:D-lactate dehydrogenase